MGKFLEEEGLSMKAKGIRIWDKENGLVTVEFSYILTEVHNGKQLHWSILFFDGIGNLGEGKSVATFKEQTINLGRGYFITWEGINDLSKRVEDLYDIILIGCFDENLLIRYKDDQEMFETCDVVIEKIDSNFWEIFSKDHDLLQRLVSKFKEIEFLETDFPK